MTGIVSLIANRFAAGTILLLLASTAFSQIASEYAVSTPVYGPANVVGAAIASDGDGFLVTWSNADGGGRFFSRISGDGTVLDPHGTFLPYGSFDGVVWTGDRYLVVWSEANNVVAMQLAADGHVLAPKRVILLNASFIQPDDYVINDVLASNGKVTVLLTDSGYAILDRDENVIDSDPFPAWGVSLTGTGEFLLQAGTGTAGLDSSGRMVAEAYRGWPFDVACRKTECLTTFYNSYTGDSQVATYDLKSLEPGPSQPLPPDFSGHLRATTNEYLLVSASIVRRLDPGGHTLSQSTALPGAGTLVATASNGRDLALLRSTSFASPLTSTIVKPTGATQPVTVAVSANSQHNVAIARGSANYLTVWAEKEGIYAGRLSLDGQPLDGRGTLIDSGTGTPSVIFDGMSYLVATKTAVNLQYNAPPSTYNEPRKIVRIDPATGSVQSVFRIGANALCLASNSSTSIAAWTEYGNLVAAFLSPDGAIASVPVFIAAPQPEMFISNLSLAWNGTTWFLAWEDEAIPEPGLPGSTPIPPPSVIRGARLSAALVPLDTKPLTVSAPMVTDILSPRAASDGRDFLVAWTTKLSYFDTPRTVTVRRVLATGAFAGPETALFPGTSQDLVWDGKSYNLAFQSASNRGDLAIARLLTSGQPFETLAISTTAGENRTASLWPVVDTHSISLLPLADGLVLAAYTRIAVEPIYSGAERAFIGVPQPLRGHAARSH
ncbi:MAG TPA: hypothetical protein VF713_09510 [Thermoanaerobaculia bacterium]